MKMTLHAALMAGLLSATPALAQTAVPSEMSYQAIVTDDLGAALAPTVPISYEVTMRIFDAATGGNLLWSERQVTDVFQGRFSIILGQGQEVPVAGGANEIRPDLATVFSDQLRFTEITVRENVGGAEAKTLAPRQKLVATATAMRARVAETALTVAPGGLSANAIPNGSLTGNIFPNGGVDSTKLGTGVVSNTEFNWLNGVTSSIQNQLNAKADNTSTQNQLNAKANSAGNATLAGSNTFTAAHNAFNNNVGIGTSGKAEKLFIYSTISPTDTAIFQRSDFRNASHIHNGPNGDIYWRSASGNGKVILQDSGGNVGIGTGSPTQARLVVSGGPVRSGIGGSFINSINAGNAVTHGDHTISIHTSNSIWCGDTVIASSDKRIKEVLGKSNSSTDLQTLLGIDVTDYRFKDQVAHDDTPQKKVIAQQLEKVFPQAVGRQTNVVPDIFEKASVADGWITLATNLKKGERVRLVATEKDGVFEVLEVEAKRFRTEFLPKKDDVLFVYGREVDDFRTVDYDAVAMLNVSATQELNRRLQAKEKEVEELKARLKTMDARMVKIESLLSTGQIPVKTVSK